MPNKQKILTVRVEEQVYNDFVEKCKIMNRQYTEIIREIMCAFVHNKLTIKQTKEQYEKIGELYDVDRK